MRVALDSCVVDWILDEPRGEELLTILERPEVEVRFYPEVSLELHRTPADKPEQRRERLLAILQPFLPVQPTRIPITGLARAGAMIIATPEAVTLREELKRMGFKKLDSLHIINAHLDHCDVFLTSDREDFLRPARRDALHAILRVRILSPEEFLEA